MPVHQIYATYDWKAAPRLEAYKYCPRCRSGLDMKMIGQKLRPVCPACGFIRFQNPAPTVSVLIVDGDRVLLGKRLEEPGAGLWALPSGYIEFDDDFLTAAIREAREETGLEVEISAILDVESAFLPPDRHYLTVFLLAYVTGGVLAASDDLEQVAWFPLTGPLPAMAFPPDTDLIQRYAATPLAGLPVDLDFARPPKR
jgi:ADP-ribose pyrophosphatase YjhB (NUDIX family)